LSARLRLPSLIVWQKYVCQRRDLLTETGSAGLACRSEGDATFDVARGQEVALTDRLHLTVAGLADLLQSTVALFEGRSRDLRFVSSAIRTASLPPIADARQMTRAGAAARHSTAPTIITVDSGVWTLLRVRRHGRAATLAVHGDHSAAAAPISATGFTLSKILERDDATSGARRQAAAHALARRLARVYGFPRMADLVSSATARLLGARVTSTAIYDPLTQVLKVQGTYGYPSPLVEHTRITPGEGVIGSVFQSGIALCVPDVRSHDDLSRNRPRYRSNSFVSVPVRAGERILGVISATDRADDRPFTRDDVSSLRALAAPVALALSRELAVSEAEQYAHAAAIDPLSGLFNRRYLHVRLEEELERARRHQIPLALLMIDLDDFKMVNDKFGHLAGDVVIKDVAVILRRTVRMFDVCTRYGGEEFAILMPNSGAQSAATVAERIRRRIESYRFSELALASLSVTASIGLAVSTSQLLPRDLIERADQALYQAKTLGKNRVWFG
jgi:diguanylate cyclase (GGDEF)-like protein